MKSMKSSALRPHCEIEGGMWFFNLHVSSTPMVHQTSLSGVGKGRLGRPLNVWHRSGHRVLPCCEAAPSTRNPAPWLQKNWGPLVSLMSMPPRLAIKNNDWPGAVWSTPGFLSAGLGIHLELSFKSMVASSILRARGCSSDATH